MPAAGNGVEKNTGDGAGVETWDERPHRGTSFGVTVWAENRRNNCSSSGSRRGVVTFSRYSRGTNWLIPAREGPVPGLEFCDVDEARERVEGDGELEEGTWYCDCAKEDAMTPVERKDCGRGPVAILVLIT